MRILHVVSTLSPRYGGPAQVCRELTKRLVARGHEVEIYTTNLDWPPSRGTLPVPVGAGFSEQGVKVHYFACEFWPFEFSLGLARALRREIGTFDLVHIHGIYRFPQIVAGYFAARAGVPYWVRPHGSLDPFIYNKPERRRWKRLFERYFAFPLLNHATRIHYTSELESQNTIQHNFRGKPLVLPNGIESDHFRALPERGRLRRQFGLEGKFVILHFGRIDQKKGLNLLVEATGRVAAHRDDIMLVLAGPEDEAYGRQVRAWAAEHGIADRTLFTGMLVGEDKLQILADADVFVLASYAENFAVAAVEAMAAGLPVVVSQEVGIWPSVREANAGIVIPCEGEALADALMRLASDRELRIRLGRNGQACAHALYDWEHVVPALEAEYRRSVNREPFGTIIETSSP